MEGIRMKKQIYLIVIVIGLLGGCSKPSKAGEYKLLHRPLLMKSTTPYAPYPKATDPSVCKAYEKNLNSFPDEIHPMSCNRRINETINGLIGIEWKLLEGSESVDLLVSAIIDKMAEREIVDESKQRTNLHNSISQRIKDRKKQISIEHFDIDNDGNGNVVIRVSNINVPPPLGCVDGKYTDSSYYYQYYIFDGKDKINKRSTRSLKYKQGSSFNVFRFNNRIYLDTWKRDYIDPWQEKNEKKWFLKVYETRPAYAGIAKRLVCEFTYSK